MKVGILGGTFDPIHLGHLIAAEEARNVLALDEVLFIPAGNPWFKADWNITPAHHRVKMTEIATASNPCFKVSSIEVEHDGPSYTVDTLVSLREQLGAPKFYLILGVDALRELYRWQEAARLFELTTIVGISRPGSDSFDLRELDNIAPGASEGAILVEGPEIGISGTDIRKRVAEGRSIKYQVPELVEAYLLENRLYTTSASL